jgi:hypothetical protein
MTKKKEFKVPEEYEPETAIEKKIWGSFLKTVPELLSYREEKENGSVSYRRVKLSV